MHVGSKGKIYSVSSPPARQRRGSGENTKKEVILSSRRRLASGEEVASPQKRSRFWLLAVVAPPARRRRDKLWHANWQILRGIKGKWEDRSEEFEFFRVPAAFSLILELGGRLWREIEVGIHVGAWIGAWISICGFYLVSSSFPFSLLILNTMNFIMVCSFHLIMSS